MAETPSLKPIEALKHIRTIIEVKAEQVYGMPAEAPFREIRAILDKAIPPHQRRRRNTRN